MIALTLGLAAALVPAPDSASPTITLLAPRGHLAAVPTRVCWSATVATPRIRLQARDAVGNLVIGRTESTLPAQRSVAFLPAEQAWLGASGPVTIELLAMSEDGELLCRSVPARIALPGKDGR